MHSLQERAGEVLRAALSRPPTERDAFLVAACKDDEALLREVGSLLMFHEGGPAEADPGAERTDFSAGEMFAGRYRMIARGRRGGMGDIWRADDLTLPTPVALKVLRSANPPDRPRILRTERLPPQTPPPALSPPRAGDHAGAKP